MIFVKRFVVQVFLLSSLLLGYSSSWASDYFYNEDLPPVKIINTADFRVDSRLAIKNQAPILILFAMEDCAYCHFVEEEHLKPMLRNPADYGDKVIIRRVMTDDFDTLIDFDGKEISNMDFSARYGAYYSPTVVFLDHNGKRLSLILGVRNTDFYGGDLDNSIELSLQKIRTQLAALKETTW
mgnify:CR=1 FL=1